MPPLTRRFGMRTAACATMLAALFATCTPTASAVPVQDKTVTTKVAAADTSAANDLTFAVEGDSPATTAARAHLKSLQTAQEQAAETYNEAQEQAAAAASELVTAQVAASLANAEWVRQKKAVGIVANQLHSDDSQASTWSWLMTAGTTDDVLDRLEMLSRAGTVQGHTATAAREAQRAAAATAYRVALLEQQARTAQTTAQTAREEATDQVADTRADVVAYHKADVAAAKAAAEAAEKAAAQSAATAQRQATLTGAPKGGNANTLAAAAATLKSQAISTQAAKASDFKAATNAAATVDIAAKAILRHAAASGDVAPTLSTTRWTGRSVGSLGGSGVGMKGAAPKLKSDGINVAPTLVAPRYPKQRLRGEVAIDTALAQLGAPYVWAAAGPTTFDCSGLVQWSYGAAGVPLAHFAGTQLRQGTPVATPDLLPGDMVFFGSGTPHHVGMYLGAGYMVDAPHTGAYVRVELVSSFGDYSGAARP